MANMFTLGRFGVALGIVLGMCCARASAQVIAQLPEPHAAKCSDFHHDRAANTWRPKVEMQITSSSGTSSIGPQNTFSAGKLVGGLDLGQLLDGMCRK